MEFKVFVLCLAAAAAVGVAAGKAVDQRRSKVGKVRFVPYFKNRVKGTGEVVQFYRAIYPPDYSDMSQMTEEAVKQLAASAVGPEENPFFVMQDDDDDPYFGRSWECRQTQMTQHDLARRCARADIFLLGWRRATIYTLWNLFVYFQPMMMFFLGAWLAFVAFNLLVQVTQAFLDFMSDIRMREEAVMNEVKNTITNLPPGVGEEGDAPLRWNPELPEMLRRLRVKVCYNCLEWRDSGRFIDYMDT